MFKFVKSLLYFVVVVVESSVTVVYPRSDQSSTGGPFTPSIRTKIFYRMFTPKVIVLNLGITKSEIRRLYSQKYNFMQDKCELSFV